MLNMEMCQGRARIAADLHYVRCRKNGDSWDQRGRKGIWRRAHQTLRRSLFTPMKVGGGPDSGGDLLGRRITEGVRRNGSKFVIKDDWKNHRRAQLLLPFEWRGHSFFFVKGAAEDDRCDDDDLGHDHIDNDRRQHRRTTTRRDRRHDKIDAAGGSCSQSC